MRPELRRRTLLTGFGAGLTGWSLASVTAVSAVSTLTLTACDTSKDKAVAEQDQVALDQVLAGELALAAQAAQVAGAVARQAAAAHRAHADALVAAGGTTTDATASPSTSTATAGSNAPALASAQRKQAAIASRLALGATPRIARLLSSIGASDASFAALLGGGR